MTTLSALFLGTPDGFPCFPRRFTVIYCVYLTEKGTIAMNNTPPSLDLWLQEAKAHESAPKIGMYLTHVGVVRRSAKAAVREGAKDTRPVTGMVFSFDPAKVEEVITAAYDQPGIYYIRVWLNEGELTVGDDIMRVLIGGDIRPHVVDGLQYLVGRLKNECVSERELN